MKINIPDYVKLLQDKLNHYGYECYLVGGCVRDSILNLEIKDYDLATNCSAGIMKDIFKDYLIINNNGEKHNTITIHINHTNVEITSYKHDDFEENTIEVDLSHRDLTMNALAYSDHLIDLYGGLDDLHQKVIRMVNNPFDRINEDPLRILRALRFSSKYGFNIEEETKKAVLSTYTRLNEISGERIKAELNEILVGKNTYHILMEYHDVIFQIIPELKDTYEYDQKNPYHKNTLYKHIVNTVVNSCVHPIVRMAALLHDIAKPLCVTTSKNGVQHYYAHPNYGSEIAAGILKRLKYSNNEIEKICYLIKNHDCTILPTKKSVKKNFSHTPGGDEKLFYMLINLMNADQLDHTKYELIDINQVKELIQQMKDASECFKLSDLAVDGYDMMQLGLEGKQIGSMLNFLLNKVIEDQVKNFKEELLQCAKESLSLEQFKL